MVPIDFTYILCRPRDVTTLGVFIDSTAIFFDLERRQIEAFEEKRLAVAITGWRRKRRSGDDERQRGSDESAKEHLADCHQIWVENSDRLLYLSCRSKCYIVIVCCHRYHLLTSAPSLLHAFSRLPGGVHGSGPEPQNFHQ